MRSQLTYPIMGVAVLLCVLLIAPDARAEFNYNICKLTVTPTSPATTDGVIISGSVSFTFTLTFSPGLSSPPTPWYLYLNEQGAPVEYSQYVDGNNFPDGIMPYGVNSLLSTNYVPADVLAGNTYFISATWDAGTQVDGDTWTPQFSNNYNDGCLAPPIKFINGAPTVTDIRNKIQACVTDQETRNSLLKQLESAGVNGLLNHIRAQSGKKISTECSSDLIRMISLL